MGCFIRWGVWIDLLVLSLDFSSDLCNLTCKNNSDRCLLKLELDTVHSRWGRMAWCCQGWVNLELSRWKWTVQASSWVMLAWLEPLPFLCLKWSHLVVEAVPLWQRVSLLPLCHPSPLLIFRRAFVEARSLPQARGTGPVLSQRVGARWTRLTKWERGLIARQAPGEKDLTPSGQDHRAVY